MKLCTLCNKNVVSPCEGKPCFLASRAGAQRKPEVANRNRQRYAEIDSRINFAGRDARRMSRRVYAERA